VFRRRSLRASRPTVDTWLIVTGLRDEAWVIGLIMMTGQVLDRVAGVSAI